MREFFSGVKNRLALDRVSRGCVVLRRQWEISYYLLLFIYIYMFVCLYARRSCILIGYYTDPYEPIRSSHGSYGPVPGDLSQERGGKT